MPLILPIEETTDFPPSALFAGETVMTASMTVIRTMRADFAGASALTANMGAVVRLSAAFGGATELLAPLRLNNEANVFLEAQFEGATGFDVDASTSREFSASFAGATALQADMDVARVADFGFTFFVDITGAAVTTALNRPSNTRLFTARLLANGVAIPIIRAELNAPADTLGVELTVVLARADVSQISATASIDFQLGVWAANAWAWSTMFSQGRMSGRGAHYANQDGLPVDSVEVSFADVVGDRWNRAPRRPTFLYDSQTVEPPAPASLSQQTIYTSAGAAISPLYEAIAGLTLFDVLDAAYVEGCGFSKVVTNIENFPVEEVAFSLTGGYDAGVRPLVSPFEPIVFPVGNELWIVTLDYPLPAGFAAREFASRLSLAIDDSLPTVEPVNGLLVHLKDSATGEYYTERLETSSQPSGTFGSDDYTVTDLERRVREYRNLDAPTVIVREDEVYLKTRKLDASFNEIAVETRTASFDGLNRPTGYTRSVSSLLPDLNDPNRTPTQQAALAETQRIDYGPHPLNPHRDVQTFIETTTRGLILVDRDNEYLEEPYRIPLNDAHRSGYVDKDSDQTTTFGAIKTVTETMRVTGGQVVRDRRVMNHVSNVEEPPTTQTLPGDASFDRRRSSGRNRTILLTTPGTDATPRRVQDFDGTGLPTQTALALAAKRLARLNAPPRDASVEMSYPDPTMRRGLDLNVRGRDGALGTFIVRGFRLVVAMQPDGSIEATMNFTAKELKA